jgi:hypothetical protein
VLLFGFAADPAERKAFLKELHELKTDIFNQLIETGRLPVRPGVKRLISEPGEGGWLWGAEAGRCWLRSWLVQCVKSTLAPVAAWHAQ